jgi:hypothetical protein
MGSHECLGSLEAFGHADVDEGGPNLVDAEPDPAPGPVREKVRLEAQRPPARGEPEQLPL